MKTLILMAILSLNLDLMTETTLKPSFPGGYEALIAYFQDHINYPTSARENGVEGIVEVVFQIDAKGKISNVEVEKGVNQAIDQEAIRVVEAMPNWNVQNVGLQASTMNVRMKIQFELTQ